MKKINIILILAFMLSACSFSGFGAKPTPKPKPTSVPSPTLTATAVPTRPTPTFTLTPTLIGYKSPTPTPEDTYTPTITLTLTDIYSKVTPFTPTPNVVMTGFDAITTSSVVFYKGRGCDPTSVKFTAQTTRKVKASFVTLFVRLESKVSGAQSGWTSIAMEDEGESVFTYSLLPDEIRGVDGYEDPWVQYQLVATSGSNKEVGRTGIFGEYLTLLRCTSTSTPPVTPTP